MRRLPLVPLLAALCAASPAAPAAPDPEAQQAVTRTYDVGGVLPALEREVETLAPLVLLGEVAPEPDGFGAGVDVVRSMLEEVVAPAAMQAETYGFDLVYDDRAVLTSTPAVHEGFARLLDHLTAALDRRASVRVEVFAAGADVDPSPDGLEAALAAGRLRRVHEQAISATIGTTTRRRATRVTRYVSAWDTQIAQSAFVPEAEHRPLETGVVTALRAEQDLASDGLRLRALLRVGRLDGLAEREADVRGTVWSEHGIERVAAGGALELPDVATLAVSMSGVLAPGGSLTALGWTRTHGEPVGLVVRLTLDAVEPAPQPLVLGTDPERVVLAVDLSALCWGPLGVAGLELHDEDRFSESGGVRFPSHDFDGEAMGAWDAAWNVLYASGEEDAAIYRIGATALLAGPRATAQAALRELTAHASPRPMRTVDVTVSDEDGVAARLRLPVLEGDRGLLVVGREGAALVHYEADVAQAAMASHPETAPFFDGIGLLADVHGGARASVSLEGHRLAALRPSPGRYPAPRATDLPVFDRFELPLLVEAGVPLRVMGVQARLEAPALAVRATLGE